MLTLEFVDQSAEGKPWFRAYCTELGVYGPGPTKERAFARLCNTLRIVVSYRFSQGAASEDEQRVVVCPDEPALWFGDAQLALHGISMTNQKQLTLRIEKESAEKDGRYVAHCPEINLYGEGATAQSAFAALCERILSTCRYRIDQKLETAHERCVMATPSEPTQWFNKEQLSQHGLT